jgi:DNA topoisomerase I
VCRKSYIHPAIVDGYMDRSLLELLGTRADAALDDLSDLQPDERAVLKFLRARAAAEQKGAAA